MFAASTGGVQEILAVDEWRKERDVKRLVENNTFFVWISREVDLLVAKWYWEGHVAVFFQTNDPTLDLEGGFRIL